MRQQFLDSIDVAHSIFVLVSKSGTTLETLTNESFVKDALEEGRSGCFQAYDRSYK